MSESLNANSFPQLSARINSNLMDIVDRPNHDWKIVLRNTQEQVVYDASKQLIQVIPIPKLSDSFCRMCGQELPVSEQPHMHSNYFRLLEDTLPDASSTSYEQPSSSYSIPASGLDDRSFNQGYYDSFFVERKKIGRFRALNKGDNEDPFSYANMFSIESFLVNSQSRLFLLAFLTIGWFAC
jgi:hypothetical protein